jgi:rhomboid protease GluP
MSGAARIATESKRQAMDWSLVLVSQGIESVIDYNETSGWGLLVSEDELNRAQHIIEQYLAENFHWPWQQPIFHPQISFDWASLAWVLLICLFFWMSGQSQDLRSAGLMDSAAVNRGEWWRLFTAIFLHADIAHLAANATFGFVLLGLAMGRFGTGVGVLATYLAGACGNIFSWLVSHPPHLSLGASGMVMGGLGLLAAQSVSLLRRDSEPSRYVVMALAAGLMLFVLMGVAPGSDVAAHFGGFAAGIFFGAILNCVPRIERSTVANIFSGAIFSLLVVWPWCLALQARK